MKEYMEKEETNELISPDDIDPKHLLVEERVFIKSMEKLINDKFNEDGIAPNTPEGTKAVNEEIALFRLGRFTQVLKQLKLDFQVNKQHLINAMKDSEELKKYSEEEI